MSKSTRRAGLYTFDKNGHALDRLEVDALLNRKTYQTMMSGGLARRLKVTVMSIPLRIGDKDFSQALIGLALDMPGYSLGAMLVAVDDLLDQSLIVGNDYLQRSF